jgi:putative ABC transport system substrate-binding protein
MNRIPSLNRRYFFAVLGGATLWPLTTAAQRGQRVRRVGFLGPERRLNKLGEGLVDFGYVEGRDFVIEYRPSDRPERLPGFAAELVRQKVDVIVASGSLAVRAAQNATRSIPIVMTGTSDPVGTGFVASLARPGGNITGLSLQSPELSGKRLAILKQIIPDLWRVGVLSNPDDPPVVFSVSKTEEAAAAMGIELQFAEARRPEEFERGFAEITVNNAQAVVLLPASIVTRNVARLAELALANGMPAISYFREFPEAGGLISYGPNLDDSARRAAAYVDKIFKGVTPSELPVEQPTKFELVINLKTAKILGVEMPPALIAGADEVFD